jgi:hypothetical protein
MIMNMNMDDEKDRKIIFLETQLNDWKRHSDDWKQLYYDQKDVCEEYRKLYFEQKKKSDLDKCFLDKK